MNDWLTPAAIGTGSALVIQAATLLLQRSKIKVDDDASLRKDLLAERESLVQEIQSLADRCSKIEKENHDLHLAQIALTKDIALLEIDKAKYKDQIERLEKEISELKNAQTEHSDPL